MRRLSYQSKQGWWKHLVVLSVFLSTISGISRVQAEPYVDTQGRFSIDVPQAWSLAPQFGDISGTRFHIRRNHESHGAWFSVKILERAPTALSKVGKNYEKEVLLAHGWRPKAKFKRSALSYFRGLEGFYQRSHPDPETHAQALTVYLSNYRGTLVVFEFALPKAGFKVHYRSDLKLFLSSFRVLKPGASRLRTVQPIELTGVWVSPEGDDIEFRKDGHFVLRKQNVVKKRGRYRLESGRLLLSTSKQNIFDVSLDYGGTRLRLSSSRLKSVLVYTKQVSKQDKGSLIGSWVNKKSSDKISLVFRSDQTFEFGSIRGRWSLSGKRLRLRNEDELEIDYEVTISEGFILVSNGDLPSSVHFRKIPGS